MRELGAGVDVWRVRFDEPFARDCLSRGLNGAEQQRAACFHFDRDRLRYASARGALRRLLARYLQRAPLEVELCTASNGKPELAGRELSFNLSHSGDLALIAVRRTGLVGVDVERLRDVEWQALSQRFFSPAEQAAVTSASEFFRVWTRKEACIKAVGVGLALGLHTFDATRPLTRIPSLDRELHMAEVAVDAGYAAALASDEPLTNIELRDWS